VRRDPLADPQPLIRRVYQSELEDLRARACAAVMPSTWFEVAGFAALEAAAAARPVVASRIGGLPEYVAHEETGLLVTPGNAAELAEGMRRLWNDRTLGARLGAEAAARARRDHDLRRAAERYLRLYQEAIVR
jgi:glycosyltransferase involved in cell wall biosynthesis